jgi:hypothetical protein
MKTVASKSRKMAFTRYDLLIVVLALVIIAGCLSPADRRLRREAAAKVCDSNLRQIGLAIKTASLGAYGDEYFMQRSTNQEGSRELVASGHVFVHFRVLAGLCSNDLSAKLLVCPADRTKVVAGNFGSGFSDANVSYFLGLDTDDTWRGLLSGDRNLAVGQQPLSHGLFTLTTNTALIWTRTIHHLHGNLLMSDGSVQFLDSSGLSRVVKSQEIATNRLAVP